MKMYPSSPCWLRSRPCDFLGLGHAQAHRGVEHLQQDERDDDRQDPGDRRGDDLPDEHGAAFDQPQRLALADIPDGPGGEDAGQDRPQRSADAVHAEGVQRVVVAELPS